jgi:hypothetical protein
VDNLNTIKKIITYHLRYSLLHTLACKHKCSIKYIFEKYSKRIIVSGRYNFEVSFLNLAEISNIKKKFLINHVEDPYELIYKMFKL